jgi:predicted TIM-barrel fold metal-dependent hydrolase
MGGFDVNAGIDDPGYRTLLELLESGSAWVKLCASRNLLTANDMEVGRPFHRAMLEANPDHLIWGSDWPHLRVTPAPDAAQLLHMLEAWTRDRTLVEQILVPNPARLYA